MSIMGGVHLPSLNADDDVKGLAETLDIHLISTSQIANEECDQKSSCQSELSSVQGKHDCVEESINRPVKGKLGQIHVNVSNPSGILQIGSNNVMCIYESDKLSKEPKKTAYKVSKRLINDDDMDQLARSLGHDWRPLGMKLGFLRGELDAFAYDHQMAGLHTIIYKMLLAWQERQGPDAWIKVMVQQLINIKRSDIAKMLI